MQDFFYYNLKYGTVAKYVEIIIIEMEPLNFKEGGQVTLEFGNHFLH